MSFAHHICCCSIFFNHINDLFGQNSKLARLLATWKMLIVAYCVKELLRKWLCIVDSASHSFYKISTFFLYDKVLNLGWYCLGGSSFPFILLCLFVSSENNWRPASGRRQYYSSSHDLISYYINKRLPAIPISSIFSICINKRGTYSAFSLSTTFFSYTNSYCIRHIN